MSGMCFYTMDENKYPLHHEDTKPLFTQVETDYMDELHKIKYNVDVVGKAHMEGIVDALLGAKKKHHKFCDGYTRSQLMHVRMWLDNVRHVNDDISKNSGYMARDILNEEVLEAEEQFLMGNKEECIKELFQVIAVAIRMIEFVEGQK